ncbi:tyrosine-type recombinase/integrase [Pelagibacterium mangrovi]|uniref:tyrosine-type recombinase/integrase n=1 Tax=Pelagibacterium mangrovi TaxID=3119828 RepID=UPI002FCBF683
MPRIDITQKTLTKAKADAKPGADRYEVTDTRARGLVLRVGPQGAGWQYRYKHRGKSVRLPLGPVDRWGVAEAREIAAGCAARLAAGPTLPTSDWLDWWLRETGRVDVEPEIVDAPVRVRRGEDAPWTWQDARDAFLDDKKATRRPKTYEDYRWHLSRAELQLLDDRLVREISVEDIAAIVSGIHRSGRESTAEHLCRVVSSMWSWLYSPAQRKRSGVQRGAMEDLVAPDRTLDEQPAEESVPSLQDLGRAIAICQVGVLDPVASCAVEMLIWTAQRRYTTAIAQVDEFTTIDGETRAWVIPSAHMKSGRKRRRGDDVHVVPLLEPAWKAWLRAGAYNEESEYAFPQRRAKRRGDELGHISEFTLSHTLSSLPGMNVSPHAVRRAFGTILERDFGVTRAETKLILDHAEGGRQSDVTGRHYALHHALRAKLPVMEIWTRELQKAVDEARRSDPWLQDLSKLKAEIRKKREARKSSNRDTVGKPRS